MELGSLFKSSNVTSLARYLKRIWAWHYILLFFFLLAWTGDGLTDCKKRCVQWIEGAMCLFDVGFFCNSATSGASKLSFCGTWLISDQLTWWDFNIFRFIGELFPCVEKFCVCHSIIESWQLEFCNIMHYPSWKCGRFQTDTQSRSYSSISRFQK